MTTPRNPHESAPAPDLPRTCSALHTDDPAAHGCQQAGQPAFTANDKPTDSATRPAHQPDLARSTRSGPHALTPRERTRAKRQIRGVGVKGDTGMKHIEPATVGLAWQAELRPLLPFCSEPAGRTTAGEPARLALLA